MDLALSLIKYHPVPSLKGLPRHLAWLDWKLVVWPFLLSRSDSAPLLAWGVMFIWEEYWSFVRTWCTVQKLLNASRFMRDANRALRYAIHVARESLTSNALHKWRLIRLVKSRSDQQLHLKRSIYVDVIIDKFNKLNRTELTRSS